MKILNTKLIEEEVDMINDMKISKSRMVDKYPCWYADLEKGKTLDKYYWRVGYVSSNCERECIVNLVNIGDINNREFLKKVFSVEFPSKLVDLFKKGGEEAVMDWVGKKSKESWEVF